MTELYYLFIYILTLYKDMCNSHFSFESFGEQLYFR